MNCIDFMYTNLACFLINIFKKYIMAFPQVNSILSICVINSFNVLFKNDADQNT